MNVSIKHCLLALFTCISLQHAAYCQPKKYTTANAHSHNDYEQSRPFAMAYNKNFGSMEADIFLLPGSDTLWVAHNAKDIEVKKKSLDELYLVPLEAAIKKNKGAVYANQKLRLQLMIDLKTEAVSTLDQLVKTLERYPTLIQCSTLQITISGNRPATGKYSTYPSFILFDGLWNIDYGAEENKVVMISENLKKFTTWNGEGSIPADQLEKVKAVIQKAHATNKKIRFWNAPDTKEAWKTLMNLGVDYINTDHIDELSEFLESKL